MSWTPNEKEIEAVILLKAPIRYAHWLKKVADQEQIWSLWNEGGWALTGNTLNRESIPVWPHSKYANLCVKGNWSGFQPISIPLDLWLNRWIPEMKRDQRLVAVFPTPEGKGVLIEPAQLEQDLRNELSKYE